MLICSCTSVSRGTQFESMLCNCRIWWNRMPSTKPPIPMPSRVPAAMAARMFEVASSGFLPWQGEREVDCRAQCGKQGKGSQDQKQHVRKVMVEDAAAHLACSGGITSNAGPGGGSDEHHTENSKRSEDGSHRALLSWTNLAPGRFCEGLRPELARRVGRCLPRNPSRSDGFGTTTSTKLETCRRSAPLPPPTAFSPSSTRRR